MKKLLQTTVFLYCFLYCFSGFSQSSPPGFDEFMQSGQNPSYEQPHYPDPLFPEHHHGSENQHEVPSDWLDFGNDTGTSQEPSIDDLLGMEQQQQQQTGPSLEDLLSQPIQDKPIDDPFKPNPHHGHHQQNQVAEQFPDSTNGTHNIETNIQPGQIGISYPSISGLPPIEHEDYDTNEGAPLNLLHLHTMMHTADWINYWLNKLATAAKVESINSVTGAVQLIGKNGIKIEPKENSEIWISSTGGGGGGGSIGIYGVQSPDGDYEYFDNITSLKFNKDSGFSVTPDDQADLLVSLGSSWTELIPDFPAEDKDNLRPSGEEKLSIKAVVTNKTGTFWDYGETNKDKKTFYIGIGRSEIGGTIPYENVYVSSDIVVTNLPYPIGAYTNGSIISNDTTVAEVFANMFARVMHPVYRLPVITISLTGITMSENYCEYGFSAADVHVKSNVKTNEGGMIEKYIYYVNDVKKGTNIVSHTNDTWKLPSQYLVSYMTLKSQVFYGQGPILPDTSGKPDDYGRIEAGDRMSDAKVISPSKYVYYGTFSEYYQINPEDIGTIINLPTRDYIAKYGNGLTISLRQGIRHTVFAVPSNVSITKVLFVVPGQADDNITETIQNSAKTVPGVYWNTYTENNKTQYTIYDYYSSAPTLNDSASLKISMIIPKN